MPGWTNFAVCLKHLSRMRTLAEIFFEVTDGSAQTIGSRSAIASDPLVLCDRTREAYLAQPDLPASDSEIAPQLFASLGALVAPRPSPHDAPPAALPSAFPGPEVPPSPTITATIAVMTGVLVASIGIGTLTLSIVLAVALGVAGYLAAGGSIRGYNPLRRARPPRAPILEQRRSAVRTPEVGRLETALRHADVLLALARAPGRSMRLLRQTSPIDDRFLAFLQDVAEAASEADGDHLVTLTSRRLPSVIETLGLHFATLDAENQKSSRSIRSPMRTARAPRSQSGRQSCKGNAACREAMRGDTFNAGHAQHSRRRDGRMPDDNIEIIGFDLGHGETALARTRLNASGEPAALEISGSRSIVTAVGRDAEGRIVIGRDVVTFSSNLVESYSRFKHPGLDAHPAAGKATRLFVRGVCDHLIETRQVARPDQAFFLVGCPSGWGPRVQNLYQAVLEQGGLRNVQGRAGVPTRLFCMRVNRGNFRAASLPAAFCSSTSDRRQQISPSARTSTPVRSSTGIPTSATSAAACSTRRFRCIRFRKQKQRSAVNSFLDRNPGKRAEVDLKCRDAKHEYFNEKQGSGREVWQAVRLERGLQLEISLDDAAMERIKNAPLAELGGRSFVSAFADRLSHVSATNWRACRTTSS